MFMIVPAWRVTAQMPEKQPGESALARPDYLSLTVADDDLEAVLRTIKRSGYEKVQFEREPYPFQQTTDTEYDGPVPRGKDSIGL